jgi:hypothetical protein
MQRFDSLQMKDFSLRCHTKIGSVANIASSKILTRDKAA